MCPSQTFSHVTQVQKSLGHLSAIYCIVFDRTGNLTITVRCTCCKYFQKSPNYFILQGADDKLIKIWSNISGRLLATLRGHSSEVSDLAVSFDNRLLASGSCDRTVRVWSLKTTGTLAVLSAHSGMITSVEVRFAA